MEVVDIHQQAASKYPRNGNGRNHPNKIGSMGIEHYPDDEDDGEPKTVSRFSGAGGGGADASGTLNRLRGWHHSSRIIRVSRASGGKDRHSKVWTSKGLRDRRVRLSVATAIQFYDLQDRLGYDQPSKAVEWLIKAAADAISELPSLDASFPETPKQLSDEKRISESTEQGFDSAEMELELDGGDHHHFHQNQTPQQLSLSKSACSSTSETSKGSGGLSLSQSDIRVNRIKARERARERTAKDKEKENDENVNRHHHISQNTPSFTELLTGCIGCSSATDQTNTSPAVSAQQSSVGDQNLFHKAAAAAAAAARQWPSNPMDYFTTSARTHQSSGFMGQIHLGNSQQTQFQVSGENQMELQHFSFVPDHLMMAAAGGSDYNLNFTISPGVSAGFSRGTLQSNSPSLLPHIQRFPPIDGSNVPFFIGAAAAASAPPPMENHHHHHQNHHQFSPAFDGRLQLYYADGSRQSDHKGKSKN